MEFIIDIVFLIVFAICIITGVIKGFVKSLMDLATNIISVVIARVFSVQLAPKIFDTYFESSITEKLENELLSLGSSAVDKVQSALSSIPESVEGFLTLLGVDKGTISENLTQQISSNGADIVDTVMLNVISPVMTTIIKIVLFVAFFALSIVILKIITVIIEKLTELPVVKQANGIFGGVFGAVKGIVLIIVLCFAVTLIAGFIDNEILSTAVESSKIINVFNLLMKDMSSVSL